MSLYSQLEESYRFIGTEVNKKKNVNVKEACENAILLLHKTGSSAGEATADSEVVRRKGRSIVCGCTDCGNTQLSLPTAVR
jgi:hypothetical protein